MTDDERTKIAIVARRLGDALDAGLIDGRQFCADMEALAEVAMLLMLLPRERYVAEIIPFPGRPS